MQQRLNERERENKLIQKWVLEISKIVSSFVSHWHYINTVVSPLFLSLSLYIYSQVETCKVHYLGKYIVFLSRSLSLLTSPSLVSFRFLSVCPMLFNVEKTCFINKSSHLDLDDRHVCNTHRVCVCVWIFFIQKHNRHLVDWGILINIGGIGSIMWKL